MEQDYTNKKIEKESKIKLNSGHKKVLVLALVIVILGAIGVIYAVNQNIVEVPEQLKSEESKIENVGHTSLSISDELGLNDAGAYESDVLIKTGANKVTGVQLEIIYNPDEIKNVDITPGEFLLEAEELEKITEEGKIIYVLRIPEGLGSVNGEGVVAVLSFEKTIEEDVVIELGTQTLVSDERYSESVISETSSTTIIAPASE